MSFREDPLDELVTQLSHFVNICRCHCRHFSNASSFIIIDSGKVDGKVEISWNNFENLIVLNFSLTERITFHRFYNLYEFVVNVGVVVRPFGISMFWRQPLSPQNNDLEDWKNGVRDDQWPNWQANQEYVF